MIPSPAAKLVVRPAAPADEAAVLAQLRALHLAERSEIASDETLRRLFERSEFLVAQADAEVIGAAAFEILRGVGFVPEPARAVATAVVVAPAWRRRGVARAMFAVLRETLRAEGCASLSLYARAGNEPAQAFYRAMGFAPDGEALTLRL